MEGWGTRGRQAIQSDVSDEEWGFVAPYLVSVPGGRAPAGALAAGGLQWTTLHCKDWEPVADDAARSAAVARGLSADATLAPGRSLRDPGPRSALATARVRRAQREANRHDPRQRTLPSTPESGARAGSDGAKRRKGSKVHAAVDTLGHLLALHVTAADEQDRAQVERLAAEVQQITGDHVELAYVDQGYPGQAAEEVAASHGIQLEVIKHTEAKRGFVLLPRRWVVERSFAWAARFRRLARDYERLSETLAGYHYLAFAWLMLANLFKLLSPSS